MVDTLNQAQRDAVNHSGSPLLVLAGAGSGKTRVITQRIARAVKRGTRPDAVLAVTFTNKAANEMTERLVRLMSARDAGQLWISTFHSFGVRFLKEESRHLGYGKSFVIMDQGDCQGLVREIAQQVHTRGLDLSAIQARISAWKNKLWSAADVPASEFEYDEVSRLVYAEYEASLRRMHAVDFDDLVAAPAQILKAHPAVRKRWQLRFEHMLIDEFQDTNRSQLDLVKLLCGPATELCAVGDDDQSIYAWRGADIRNILEFETHFAGARVVKLETNYRSTPAVLSVANAVMAAAPEKRHAKVLHAHQAAGEPVRVAVCDDPAAEAKFVRLEIRRLRQAGMQPSEIAVLYRSNLQARLIEEELRTDGQPYRMLGGTQFFERKEVKDALAYLRAALSPRDELALRRILNYPPRGIGEVSLEKIERLMPQCGDSLRGALKLFVTQADAPAEARTAVEQLLNHLARAASSLRKGNEVGRHAREFLNAVGLNAAFLDGKRAGSDGKPGLLRYPNVEALVETLDRCTGHPNGSSLQDVLTQFMLREPQQTEETGNRITLCTLHAAKGLEFDCVFVIGCSEGILPHIRTLDPRLSDAAVADVEEERRLFYVGITRAKRLLYLCRAKTRAMRGRTQLLAPSRFLLDIPEDQLLKCEAPEMQVADYDEVSAIIQQFLNPATQAPS